MSHIYAEVFNCGLALIRLCMHIYMYIEDVFIFGLLSYGSIYIGVYIYMEVFGLQPRA